MGFLDNNILTPKSVGLVWEGQADSAKPRLGEAFFPSVKQYSSDISWFVGEIKQAPLLKPSAFGAKAELRDRASFSRVQTELPFFREGVLVTEKDRRELMRAKATGDAYVNEVLAKIFDDTNNLIEGAMDVAELMRMQLISSAGSPSIDIGYESANGDVEVKYNYDPDGSFATNNYVEIATATEQWSDTENADPIKNIVDAISAIQATGQGKPNLAICSPKVLKMLVNNKKIKGYVTAANASGLMPYITEAMVVNLIKDLTGVTVIAYDRKYTDYKGEVKPFYPENMFTLLPDMPLGQTVYGTTTEEDMLEAHRFYVVNNGITITFHEEVDPIVHKIYATQLVLPKFQNLKNIFVLKVAA